MLASVQFTSIVDFMVVMPLGPQLMRTLGITSSQFGLIVSSYTISRGVAGIFASSFMDRFGRKAAFLTLYSGFLVGTFLCGLAQSYPTLLAARVVTGAFGGILGGMALAIVGDVFPEHKRGRATGVLMSAFALASVVGVPVGIYLGNRFDWHVAVPGAGGAGIAGLLAASQDPAALAWPPANGPHAHPLAKLAETFSHANHLRAFAPGRHDDAGRVRGDPVHLGVPGAQPRRSRDGPAGHLRHRRPADAGRCADRRTAGGPLWQAAGLPRGRDDLGGPDDAS